MAFVDKHNRTIMGYLCENGQTVVYCCIECDTEFTEATELEEHLRTHKKPASRRVSAAAYEQIAASKANIVGGKRIGDTLSEDDTLKVLTIYSSVDTLHQKYPKLI